MSTSPECVIWYSMLQRCSDPTHSKYAYYGGRGITVCARWQDSFEAFYADMGPRPSPAHSLDRYPDHDGPYAPENCRWATKHEQMRNMRSNRWLTYNGMTMCLADWARYTEIHGTPISVQTLRKRLRNGWSVDVALTTHPDPAYSRTKRPASP